MEVRFVLPDLRRLDELKSEALALALFEDVRPFQGALGLADWRLAGHVSRLVVDGRVRGARGERLLIPARPRLTLDKIFLFGAGPRERFREERYEDVVEEMLDTLDRARVRSSVVALPGRGIDAVEPADAFATFLRLANAHPEHDQVTVIDDAAGQRAMAPVLEQERRRVRAIG
ncbi:MAG: M17 family peptidase N-terminal domain-containing protein [Sandaracinaceae bacterium]